MAQPKSKLALQEIVFLTAKLGFPVTSEDWSKRGIRVSPLAFNPSGELLVWNRSVSAAVGRWILVELCLKTRRITVWGSNDEEQKYFLWKEVLKDEDLFQGCRIRYAARLKK